MEKKKGVLELILSGERLTKKVSTKRGIFVIGFPLPRDLREIEIAIAGMLENNSIESFSNEQISNFRAYATLDKMIINAPGWWNKLNSSEDCPDDKLIMNLYRRYLRFYGETQELINKSGFNGESKGSES